LSAAFSSRPSRSKKSLQGLRICSAYAIERFEDVCGRTSNSLECGVSVNTIAQYGELQGLDSCSAYAIERLLRGASRATLAPTGCFWPINPVGKHS